MADVITRETAAAVWAAVKQATGHDDEPFAACPAGCPVDEEHRHYQRAPGAYFKITEPAPCCGREWMRLDEYFGFDTCTWCRADGNWYGTTILPQTVTPVRDPQRRRHLR